MQDFCLLDSCIQGYLRIFQIRNTKPLKKRYKFQVFCKNLECFLENCKTKTTGWVFYATSGRKMEVNNFSWKCSMSCRDNYRPAQPTQVDLMKSLCVSGLWFSFDCIHAYSIKQEKAPSKLVRRHCSPCRGITEYRHINDHLPYLP